MYVEDRGSLVSTAAVINGNMADTLTGSRQVLVQVRDYSCSLQVFCHFFCNPYNWITIGDYRQSVVQTGGMEFGRCGVFRSVHQETANKNQNSAPCILTIILQSIFCKSPNFMEVQ